MNARERSSKNPLFSGEPGLWNGILIKKMPRAIRFAAGEDVTVATNADAYTETTATAAVDTDRSILLGGQALAEVYGKHTQSGTHFNWHEEVTDHGNTLEASIASITGCAKIRFEDAASRVNDHGVLVIDSYAPAP